MGVFEFLKKKLLTEKRALMTLVFYYFNKRVQRYNKLLSNGIPKYYK